MSARHKHDLHKTATIHLPPEPRAMDALGRNHTLEGALAELVDNSIDAGAEAVTVRFLEADRSLSCIEVVDSGRGMGEEDVDSAMTLGGLREYLDGEIGRFGFGLKAASFSQAESLTVLSRRTGKGGVGRRLSRSGVTKNFACDVLDRGDVAAVLDEEPAVDRGAGTVIRWEQVKGFPSHGDQEEFERFLDDALQRVSTFLAMTFHRFLSDGRVSISVETGHADEDVTYGDALDPLDPFAYTRTGAPRWPKDLKLDGRHVLRCHVWPARSTLDEFRLDGDPIARQGLYVYLKDRLVQAGGWNGLVVADRRLALARACLDVRGDIAGFLAVKPEKNGIEPGPRFETIIRKARASGAGSFEAWLDTARETVSAANRRARARAPKLPVAHGFDPRVRRAVKRELKARDGTAVSVVWKRLPWDEFFDLDRKRAVIYLNSRYRPWLSAKSGLNDTPLIKTLMYLLLEDVIAGRALGPRDKDNLELWQTLLVAAVDAETR
jgi:hypothetical protein